MPPKPDGSVATRHFFPFEDRTCLGCGQPQRYKYKSSGRYFYQLGGLQYVDAQIVYCCNGRCPLRFKPMHPPQELAMAAQKKGYGFDVIACIGHMRYRDTLTRFEILTRLGKEFPQLVISEREVEVLYKLYGALVSGTTLKDPAVIKLIKKNKAIVLSLHGAKPIKDHESVWFVRDLVSGVTLAAIAMRSCTKKALIGLLRPIKEFARSIGVPVVGVVSDAESKVRAAVRKVFPRVRHQLCQFHYVGNLADPLVKKDRKLHKAIKESLPELGDLERKIQQETAANGSSLSKPQASVLSDLCEIIRTILRRTGKPPFDPPGLRLFQELQELRQVAQEMMKRAKTGRAYIQALIDLLAVVDKFRDDEKWLRAFYADIKEVADILFVKAKTTKGAKRLLREMKEKWTLQLTRKAAGLDEDSWTILANWCNQTDNYWPGLFHCYADPRIPATNNDMERLVKKIKQLERVISKNPNPANRFILHAATNALVTGRPELPGAEFLAKCDPAMKRQTEARLRAQQQRRGVAWRAIRNFQGDKEDILERWRLACAEADAAETQSTSRLRAA